MSGWHHQLDPAERHGTSAWLVANSAARAALVVAAEDIGKECWQQDEDSFWVLKSVSPAVWVSKHGVSQASNSLAPINAQTGTAYTLSLGDAGATVEMDNAAANTVTIPPNASVALPVGVPILVRQMGAGQTTLVAGSGVTIRNPHGTLKLAKQYAAVSLHKRGTDDWCVEGNLAES